MKRSWSAFLKRGCFKQLRRHVLGHVELAVEVLGSAADLDLAFVEQMLQRLGGRLHRVEAADDALGLELAGADRAVAEDLLDQLPLDRLQLLEMHAAFHRLVEVLQELRQPIAPGGEDRVMRLQHPAFAIDHLVEVADRRVAARGPGDLVVAQAGAR